MNLIRRPHQVLVAVVLVAVSVGAVFVGASTAPPFASSTVSALRSEAHLNAEAPGAIRTATDPHPSSSGTLAAAVCLRASLAVLCAAVCCARATHRWSKLASGLVPLPLRI